MEKKQSEITVNVNHELCQMLFELADYEKNSSRNIYKHNAYRKAAQILAAHPVKITSGEEAMKLHGIGKKIAEKIQTFLDTGNLPKLEVIKKDEKYKAIKLLMKVSGIGPAKAQQLVEEGVRTLEDLEKAKNLLTRHQKIGLKYFHDFELKIPRDEVANIEKKIKKIMSEVGEDFIVTICGSYRRGKETSGDVDCLITHRDYISQDSKQNKAMHEQSLKDAVDQLIINGLVIETIALGKTKFMGVCQLSGENPARRLDIRLTPYDQYFCSVLYFTGSDLFNKNMRAHALEKGFTLNEYSLRPFGISGDLGEPLPITCEKDIFDYIDYPYKPPAKRDI